MESSGEMTGSLREMNERRAKWLAEKPGGDWGDELRYQENDLIIFQFTSSGNDGDQFVKLYRAHEFDIVTRSGRTGSTFRYCPVQNGEEAECPYCAQGNTTLKERMSIWMYVMNIMHTTMPPEKSYPQVNYQGRLYFNEEVNAFKIWHASAWRDSPWNDILNIAEMYKGLHGFTAQMAVVGKELQRRYKIYALPNSTQVTPELYERAKAECASIPQLLKEQMAGAVQSAPVQQAAGSPVPTGAAPFQIPGSNAAPVWQPPSGEPNQSVTPDTLTPIPQPNPQNPPKSLF